MATTRYSKQREAIHDYLLSTREHPTAEMIYKHIQQVYPHISLGTVYRNLNLLVKQGNILRLDCGDGIDHFDGYTDPHYHFYCKNCGNILDLNINISENLNDMAMAEFEGQVQGHTMYFYGLCPDCFKSIE